MFAIKKITIRYGPCIFNRGEDAPFGFAGNLTRHGTQMPDQTTQPAGRRLAVASYVATLSADLAAMARDTGLETLGYLLEMVRLEAESSARQNGSNGRRS